MRIVRTVLHRHVSGEFPVRQRDQHDAVSLFLLRQDPIEVFDRAVAFSEVTGQLRPGEQACIQSLNGDVHVLTVYHRWDTKASMAATIVRDQC
jgi:hypothetical protein